MVELTIRASSLPQYPDCARRWAAKMASDPYGGRLAGLVADAGYELRQTDNSAGAATGTATHTGAALVNQAHMDTGELASLSDATDAAMDELDRVLQQGCVWDGTTNNRSTAQKQVHRQVRAYRAKVAPLFVPIAVEERLEAEIAPGVMLTGQVDLGQDGGLRDLKTGVMSRPNGAQYGAYSLLRRSHGHRVDFLVEDFVRRARITADQPDPVQFKHPIDVAERAAHEIIQRIIGDIETFAQSGESWAFIANPNSMLCGDKWCPAWGTRFCRNHKEAV